MPQGANDGAPGARTCKVCGRPEGVVAFRPSSVIQGKVVVRRKCADCDNAGRKAARHAQSNPTAPTHAPANWAPPPAMALQRALFIPDTHVPNHDAKALALVLSVARALRPHHLVVLGDFVDGESLSLHEPDVPGAQDFEAELQEVRAALKLLDAVGAESKIYIEGNHEQRLGRLLARKAPSLYRSLSLPAMLGLQETGWRWVPYRQSVKLGRLNLTHDTGSAGINAHRQSAARFMGSTVIGHTHRMAYEVTGRFDAAPYLACMLGWLGDRTRAAKYLHEASAASWVHGFGVGYLEPASGVVYLTPVPIIDGRCVVEGVLYG